MFKNYSHHFVLYLLLQVAHNANCLFAGENCALILSVFPTTHVTARCQHTIHLSKRKKKEVKVSSSWYSNSYKQEMKSANTRIN